MNCGEARQKILDGLDGGFEPLDSRFRGNDPGNEAASAGLRLGEALELREHLAGCGECRAYDSQMRQIVQALGKLHAETELWVADAEERQTPRWPARRLPPVRRLIYVTGRIAACLGLLAAGYAWYANRFADHGGQETNHLMVGTSPEAPDAVGLTLHDESAGQYLVVATPSAAAHVDLYWLYPVLVQTKDRG